MSPLAPSEERIEPRLSQPFEDWRNAFASLATAEARRAHHADLVRLSVEVIRTRNALALDRMQAGWQPPDHIVERLAADDRLLQWRDETGRSFL
jgi:hypothetical protein